jgi:hypothetical protein
MLTLSTYSEQLKSLGIANYEAQHLPTSWLIVAGCISACGLGLVIFGVRRNGSFTTSGEPGDVSSRIGGTEAI